MLKLSANKKNHYKDKDILILFKNMKIVKDTIPIETLLDLITSEWP